MRILVAPDKFKGCLTASQAADAICCGLAGTHPRARMDVQLLADGGEGTVEAFTGMMGGEIRTGTAANALGERVSCRFGWVPESHTAILEMAEASGLWRIGAGQRRPLEATKFGTGEQIVAARHLGARTILVGLGGSATNDAGAGLGAALGYQFLDGSGNSVAPEPAVFPRIARVVAPDEPVGVEVVGLSDVTNPLLGPRGATRIFGAQKGAAPDQLDQLEDALGHFADVVERDLGIFVRDTPGAGAAGGLGFGLMAFCGARLQSGFETLSAWTNLETRVAEADWIVTAEGSLDAQSLDGKGPGALAALSRKLGKPVAAIAGRIADEDRLKSVFEIVLPLSEAPLPLDESMARAAELLGSAATRLGRMQQFKLSS